MESLDQVRIAEAVKSSMRYTNAHTFGSRVMSTVVSDPDSFTRARKLGEQRDLIVQKEDFSNELQKRYQEVPEGETRLLVAGTGTGKSTILPCLLSSKFSTSGLVLVPDGLLAVVLHKYVSTKVAGKLYPDVVAKVLRPSDVNTSGGGTVVYYTAAAEFLSMYASDRSLLHRLGISYVYVDEAHEVKPEYYVLKVLVSSKCFPGVKLFFGSATASSVDLESNSSSLRNIVSVNPSHLDVSSAVSLTNNSPLHHTNITTRVLVFVNGSEQIKFLQNYYDEHDIPVYLYDEYTSSKAYTEILHKLSMDSTCVLLTTSVLQTGHTLDVDRVIDCGGTRRLRVTANSTKIRVNTEVVSRSERIQRCGRVGRHKPGTAYFSDVESYSTKDEVIPGSECYVYLWCRLFGVESNTDLYKYGMDILGSMSVKKASLLLHSRVHPLVMTYYMNSEGQFYYNWADVFACVFPQATLTSTDEHIHESIRAWPTMYTKPGSFTDNAMEFKAPVDVPLEWYPSLFVAFKSVADEDFDVELDPEFDSKSVVTMYTSAKPPTKYKRETYIQPPSIRGSAVVDSVPFTRKPKPKEVHLQKSLPVPNSTKKSLKKHVRSHSTTALSTVNEVPTVKSYAKLSDLGSNASASTVDMTPLKNVLEQQGVTPMLDAKSERILKYVENTQAGSPTHSRSSEESRYSVRATQDLHPIRASKLALQKVYPMDEILRSEYSDREAYTGSDLRRYRELVEMDKHINQLTEDRRARYFLAVVRIRNTAAVDFIQQQARQKQSKLRTFIPYVKTHEENSNNRLDKCKQLLIAFETERLYVGVDVRSYHSRHSQQSSPTFPIQVSMANTALSWGNDVTRQTVQKLLHSVVEVKHDGNRVCVALTLLKMVVLPFHSVATIMNTVCTTFDVSETYIDVFHDICVLHTQDTMTQVADLSYNFRAPESGEEFLAVGINFLTSEAETLGVYKVFGIDDKWLTTAELDFGCSGMVFVSTGDGAIIGMHQGALLTGYDSPCSSMISADKIDTIIKQFS